MSGMAIQTLWGTTARRLGLALLLPALLIGCAAPEKPVATKPELIVYPLPPDEPRFYYERTLTNSANVVNVSDEIRLRVLLTGSTGVMARGMSKPFTVAVHKGRVFVSDTVGRVIYGFDYPEEKFLEIGRSEPGQVAKPLGIDVDLAGNLYAIDATFKRVTVYTRDGKFLRTFGGTKMFDRPSGIAVTPDGAKVFVVDTGGVSSRNHRVRVFDGVSGEHLYDIGTRGTGEGQFNLPREAEIGPDGRLYVVDGGNFRIQVFEQDGTFVRTWGKPGRMRGLFMRPKGISLDAEGNVYVSDAAFSNIQIFDAEGQLLMHMGGRSDRSRPGRFMLAAGVDVDEDGRIYFVGQFFRKVDIFRPAGLEIDEGYLAGNPVEK